MKRILLSLLVAALATACGQPSQAPSGTPTQSATPTPEATSSQAQAPSQQAAVATLQKLAMALEKKDYEAAAALVKVPKGMPPDRVNQELAKTYERKEISAAGVEALDKGGKWGSATEVLGQDRAEHFAEKSDVPVDQCYALVLGDAEAVLFWDGAQFLAIRFDDIGKLTQ